jgi:hypothetical protein
VAVIEDDFPDFYHRADAYAERWQRLYLWAERIQLGALLLAAGVAAVGAGPAFVIVSFSVALVAQLFKLTTRADERWWNGRAGAESAKRASWLYVAAGSPFDATNGAAAAELASRIADTARDVADLAPIAAAQGHVTSQMQAARAEPLPDRVTRYRHQRIRRQQTWYADRSAHYDRWGTVWGAVGIAAQGLGLVFGIIAAVNDWTLDVVGLLTALGASAVAWSAVKQYGVLTRSYAVTSNELGVIDARITGTTWTEPAWAAFVNEAEEAISREHASWCATRAI